MDKILYIHQYYNTPESGGPLRSWHFSQSLADAGYEVELITAHNSKIYKKEQHNKVTVHYLPVVYKNEFGSLRRILAFLQFMYLSAKLGKSLKAKLCLASSTPLSTGITALYLKKWCKLPYIFEVRDLWPQAPIELGFLKTRLIQKLAKSIEKLIYRNAEAIISLSPGIEKGISETGISTPIYTITNFADFDFFNEKRNVAGKKNKILSIVYFGSAGLANALPQLLLLAEQCEKENLPIQFKIAAKGSTLKDLKAIVRAQNLQSISFHSYLNREELRDFLSEADLSFLSFAQVEVLKTCSPNKLFESLAMGLPIISTIDGWWMPFLKEANCGVLFRPERPEDTIPFLKQLLKEPHMLAALQHNARLLAETAFNKNQHCEKLVNLVSKHISA